MRRAITALVGVVTLAAPSADALAAVHHRTAKKAKPKKRVVTLTKKVVGTQSQADRWGNVEVTLVVKKTTTILGRTKRIKRTITDVQVPIYPNHTDRSVFINQQAIPLLRQEVLKAQIGMKSLQLISGATATSYAFADSLQAALLNARKL